MQYIYILHDIHQPLRDKEWFTSRSSATTSTYIIWVCCCSIDIVYSGANTCCAWPYAIDLWLLLTHHYQFHTATCSSYHECVACSSTCSCKLKWFFARGCYSLITINFILLRVARITTNLHVLSVCSWKLKCSLARGCYSLITVNFILPRVARITTNLHVLSVCSCKLKCFLQVVATHSSLSTSYCHV